MGKPLTFWNDHYGNLRDHWFVLFIIVGVVAFVALFCGTIYYLQSKQPVKVYDVIVYSEAGCAVRTYRGVSGVYVDRGGSFDSGTGNVRFTYEGRVHEVRGSYELILVGEKERERGD